MLRALLPRRIRRAPGECDVVLSYREPDQLLEDGTIRPGDELVMRQRAGTGWRWLGRVWLWRDWR